LLGAETKWWQALGRVGEAFMSSRVGPLVVGALLFWAGVVDQAPRPGEFAIRHSWYFLFIVADQRGAERVLFRVAARLINWRALVFVQLHFSDRVFWEATLGVPYQWWGYRSAQNDGLFVRAFCDLPLEAVVVWVFANWTTVLVYETILFAFHVGEKRFGGCFSSQTRNCANSGNEAEVMVRSVCSKPGTRPVAAVNRGAVGVKPSRSSFAMNRD